MAAVISLPDLLTTLTESVTSATSSFPVSSDCLVPPADGISLLDTKNDLLLSYLQNLVFLIILKLRNGSDGVKLDDGSQAGGDKAVEQLVEIRAYLEKGVRPLEGRLKYQIEKVLRAADDAERKQESTLTKRKIAKGTKATGEGSDASESDSESAGSEDTTTSPEAQQKIDDLSYRPNPSALLRKSDAGQAFKSSSYNPRSGTTSSGTYKPPRITPTSMPSLPSTSTNPTRADSRSSIRNRKSHLLDEYISTELSSTPTTEPSIGSNSTILKRGRGALSARERDKERERTEYEERNFSRLPKESKAERRKVKARGGDGGRRDGFGGEDWTGLGEVGDRVARSVGRGSASASAREGKGGVLERREKRRREGGDVAVGRAGGGVGIGESFEKKRKIMEGRAERKRKGR